MGAIPGVAAQTQEVCYSTMRAREHAHRDAIASVYQVDASQLQGPPPTTYVTSFDHRSPAAYPLPRSASINPTHPTNPYSAANPHPNIKVFPPSSQSPIPDPPSAFPATPAGYPHTPDADPEALSARQEHAHGTPRSGRSPNVRFTPAQERYYDRFSTKRHSHLNSPQTAPVNPAFSSPGAYPFPGYSSKTQQPQTAYPSVFPRPLFTGQPVQKDREREVRNEVA
ncbi:hypothetical protein DXG03_006494 [Asterophora parasitica]|uniref:Uncharacterized protein n=1 Tax=Asterophora parasitica TaxID=117018 RepID=A0A9P7G9L2_9AGAR|nr:hypothetical protein DXG03_006494 [Asterophora parasitica]